MTPAQIQLSGQLKQHFPAYVNALQLRTPGGAPLHLDAAGHGSFKDYVESFIIGSAQKALADGQDLTSISPVKVENGKVTGLDFDDYVRFATRMKVTPAFDAQDLSSPENDLFGNPTVKARHFTRFGQEHTTVPATLAEADQVRLMNAMSYVGTKDSATSRFWRIRHGALDRDTSFAVPVILATKLSNTGHTVDFALPWGVSHGGDYDLDELFDWIVRVTR
jgi:hypothetical protein